MEAAKQQVVAAVDQVDVAEQIEVVCPPCQAPPSTITHPTGGTKLFSLVLGRLSLAAGLYNAQILTSVISVISEK